MSGINRKSLTALTLQEKKEIIGKIKEFDLKPANVADEYGIDLSTVYRILRNSEKILKELEENPHFSDRRRNVPCLNDG
jgi:DNA invertase Pin-like site-specific DNA recombinase